MSTNNTGYRNYLKEAYEIAEDKKTSLGLRWLPEANHIQALVAVIENQRCALEEMNEDIRGVLKETHQGED